MKLCPVLIESGWLIRKEEREITWIFVTEKEGKWSAGMDHSESWIQGAFRGCLFGTLSLLFAKRSLWQTPKSISYINPITLLGWVLKIEEWSPREAGENEGKMVELVVWSEWGRNSPLSFWGIWQGGNFRWGPSYLGSVISRKRREFRNFPAACGPKLNLVLN